MTYTDHQQRLLDQDESMHRSPRPVRIPAWFNLILSIGHLPCRGGECDLDDPCFRHSHADETAARLHRMRGGR